MAAAYGLHESDRIAAVLSSVVYEGHAASCQGRSTSKERIQQILDEPSLARVFGLNRFRVHESNRDTALIIDSKTGTAYVAVRGSVEGFRDWGLQNAVNYVVGFHQRLEKVIDMVRVGQHLESIGVVRSVVVTGHSLGGALARAASIYCHTNYVAIDAPNVDFHPNSFIGVVGNKLARFLKAEETRDYHLSRQEYADRTANMREGQGLEIRMKGDLVSNIYDLTSLFGKLIIPENAVKYITVDLPPDLKGVVGSGIQAALAAHRLDYLLKAVLDVQEFQAFCESLTTAVRKSVETVFSGREAVQPQPPTTTARPMEVTEQQVIASGLTTVRQTEQLTKVEGNGQKGKPLPFEVSNKNAHYVASVTTREEEGLFTKQKTVTTSYIEEGKNKVVHTSTSTTVHASKHVTRAVEGIKDSVVSDFMSSVLSTSKGRVNVGDMARNAGVHGATSFASSVIADQVEARKLLDWAPTESKGDITSAILGAGIKAVSKDFDEAARILGKAAINTGLNHVGAPTLSQAEYGIHGSFFGGGSVEGVSKESNLGYSVGRCKVGLNHTKTNMVRKTHKGTYHEKHSMLGFGVSESKGSVTVGIRDKRWTMEEKTTIKDGIITTENAHGKSFGQLSVNIRAGDRFQSLNLLPAFKSHSVYTATQRREDGKPFEQKTNLPCKHISQNIKDTTLFPQKVDAFREMQGAESTSTVNPKVSEAASKTDKLKQGFINNATEGTGRSENVMEKSDQKTDKSFFLGLNQSSTQVLSQSGQAVEKGCVVNERIDGEFHITDIHTKIVETSFHDILSETIRKRRLFKRTRVFQKLYNPGENRKETIDSIENKTTSLIQQKDGQEIETRSGSIEGDDKSSTRWVEYDMFKVSENSDKQYFKTNQNVKTGQTDVYGLRTEVTTGPVEKSFSPDGTKFIEKTVSTTRDLEYQDLREKYEVINNGKSTNEVYNAGQKREYEEVYSSVDTQTLLSNADKSKLADVNVGRTTLGGVSGELDCEMYFEETHDIITTEHVETDDGSVPKIDKTVTVHLHGSFLLSGDKVPVEGSSKYGDVDSVRERQSLISGYAKQQVVSTLNGENKLPEGSQNIEYDLATKIDIDSEIWTANPEQNKILKPAEVHVEGNKTTTKITSSITQQAITETSISVENDGPQESKVSRRQVDTGVIIDGQETRSSKGSILVDSTVVRNEEVHSFQETSKIESGSGSGAVLSDTKQETKLIMKIKHEKSTKAGIFLNKVQETTTKTYLDAEVLRQEDVHTQQQNAQNQSANNGVRVSENNYHELTVASERGISAFVSGMTTICLDYVHGVKRDDNKAANLAVNTTESFLLGMAGAAASGGSAVGGLALAGAATIGAHIIKQSNKKDKESGEQEQKYDYTDLCANVAQASLQVASCAQTIVNGSTAVLVSGQVVNMVKTGFDYKNGKISGQDATKSAIANVGTMFGCSMISSFFSPLIMNGVSCIASGLMYSAIGAAVPAALFSITAYYLTPRISDFLNRVWPSGNNKERYLVLCKIYDINPNCNPEELKAAVKRQALKYHPDKGGRKEDFVKYSEETKELFQLRIQLEPTNFKTILISFTSKLFDMFQALKTNYDASRYDQFLQYLNDWNGSGAIAW